MPVYEYICDRCHAKTETIRTMAQADAPISCEQCGSDQTHRTHSVFVAGSTTGSDRHSPQTGSCSRCGDPAGPCGY